MKRRVFFPLFVTAMMFLAAQSAHGQSSNTADSDNVSLRIDVLNHTDSAISSTRTLTRMKVLFSVRVSEFFAGENLLLQVFDSEESDPFGVTAKLFNARGDLVTDEPNPLSGGIKYVIMKFPEELNAGNQAYYEAEVLYVHQTSLDDAVSLSVKAFGHNRSSVKVRSNISLMN